MKAIKHRYFLMREHYPEPYSSYICFARAVAGQRLSRKKISRWFNILVDKDDYDPIDRNSLVGQLCVHSKTPEERRFGHKYRSSATKKKKTVNPPKGPKIIKASDKRK